jgi:hypothetical protein
VKPSYKDSLTSTILLPLPEEEEEEEEEEESLSVLFILFPYL